MIDKKILFEEVVLDNLNRVEKAKIIDRDKDIKLLPNKIKVIYGVRRGGKTYFLFQIIISILRMISSI